MPHLVIGLLACALLAVAVAQWRPLKKILNWFVLQRFAKNYDPTRMDECIDVQGLQRWDHDQLHDVVQVQRRKLIRCAVPEKRP